MDTAAPLDPSALQCSCPAFVRQESFVDAYVSWNSSLLHIRYSGKQHISSCRNCFQGIAPSASRQQMQQVTSDHRQICRFCRLLSVSSTASRGDKLHSWLCPMCRHLMTPWCKAWLTWIQRQCLIRILMHLLSSIMSRKCGRPLRATCSGGCVLKCPASGPPQQRWSCRS